MKLFTAFTCFSVIVFVCFMSTSAKSSVKKCCDEGEIFENVNGTYACTEDATKRLQIITAETGFLYLNNTKECVEVFEDFFVFNVSSEVIIPLGQVNQKVFPKCCPLNYVYNSVIHSCEETKNVDHRYIKENFVKIGLPNCRVMVDYELNETYGMDYEYVLKDSALSIPRRNSLDSIISYCIDQTQIGGYVLRECKDSIEVCKEIRCFKKCCPDGQSFIGGDKCFDTYEFGLNISELAEAITNPTGKVQEGQISVYLIKI